MTTRYPHPPPSQPTPPEDRDTSSEAAASVPQLEGSESHSPNEQTSAPSQRGPDPLLIAGAIALFGGGLLLGGKFSPALQPQGDFDYSPYNSTRPQQAGDYSDNARDNVRNDENEAKEREDSDDSETSLKQDDESKVQWPNLARLPGEGTGFQPGDDAAAIAPSPIAQEPRISKPPRRGPENNQRDGDRPGKDSGNRPDTRTDTPKPPTTPTVPPTSSPPSPPTETPNPPAKPPTTPPPNNPPTQPPAPPQKPKPPIQQPPSQESPPKVAIDFTRRGTRSLPKFAGLNLEPSPGNVIAAARRSGNCESEIIPVVPRAELEAEARQPKVEQTMAAHPTFLMYLGADTERTPREVEVTLQNQKGDQQLYKRVFSWSGQSGIVAVSLPKSKPPLEVGKPYLWQASMRCKSGDDSKSRIAATWVQRVARTPVPADPGERTFFYAEKGLWFDTVISIFQNTNESQAAKDWQTLIQQEQLPSAWKTVPRQQLP